MTESEIPHPLELTREAILSAAKDPALVALRLGLAKFTSEEFYQVGRLLHVSGYIVGPDRAAGVSPFGYGSDEVVAISTLLRIASQLVSAGADLFSDGRTYAAAALLRQMVEIEYLAWAFETRDRDAERWLRSDKLERQDFFTPAKLRKAANGKFSGKDYGYHCELGGHPVPKGVLLLSEDSIFAQLLLSDLLGHAREIWKHLVGWAERHNEQCILERAIEMSRRHADWEAKDAFTNLPSLPE